MGGVEEHDIDLFDELPLSQEDAHGQPPGGADDRSIADASDHAALPDELPLSQASAASGGAIGSQAHVQPTEDATPHGDSATPPTPPSEPDIVMANRGRSKGRGRGGRPNRSLQEALREVAGNLNLAPQPEAHGAEQQVAQIPVGPGARGSSEALANDRAELVKKARVPEDAGGHLVKRAIGGYPQMSPLSEGLVACAELGKRPGERHDDETLQAVAKFLSATPLAIGSKRLRAESAGVSVDKLNALTLQVGTTVCLLDRWGRATMEKAIAMHLRPEQLLLYVDCVAYDETPMSMAIMEAQPSASAASSGSLAVQVVPAEQPQGMLSLRRGSPLAGLAGKQQGVQKIMQIVQDGGMLLNINGHFVTLFTNTICSLTAMPSASAAAIKETQVRVSGVSRGATKFAKATRVACTDRYSANLSAEPAVVEERGAPWSGLHVHCDIHKTARIYTKAFSAFENHIRGMIHTALALGTGTSLARFRKAVKEEIASRFVLKHGSPPVEAVQYKQAIMSVFLSGGKQVAVRRILLAQAPNGDWRNHEIEYYVPLIQPQPTREQCLEHMVAGLLAAFTACKPHLYPRHRWTGAEMTVDSLGIFEACHKLLSTSFMRFAAGFEPASRARAVLGAGGSAAQQGRAANAIDDEQPGVADDDPLPAPASMQEDLGGPQQNAGGNGQEKDWAAINATHRRIGAEWLQSGALPSLMMMRISMEPLRRLMVKQFKVAGAEWELRQEGKLLDALAAGQSTDFQTRDYRLSLAASGWDEEEFFQKLMQAFEGTALWAIFPRGAHTEAFRAMGFKVLSKAGAGVKELLDFAHDHYPIKMFILLANPHLAADLLQDPECVMDQWSADLRRRHPTLEGEAFMHELGLIAQLSRKDISIVEAKHASLRRMLVSGGVQTHELGFTDLAAGWCMQQFRRRQQRFRRPGGHGAQKKACENGQRMCRTFNPQDSRPRDRVRRPLPKDA